jgi:hypothetical protein
MRLPEKVHPQSLVAYVVAVVVVESLETSHIHIANRNRRFGRCVDEGEPEILLPVTHIPQDAERFAHAS